MYYTKCISFESLKVYTQNVDKMLELIMVSTAVHPTFFTHNCESIPPQWDEMYLMFKLNFNGNDDLQLRPETLQTAKLS